MQEQDQRTKVGPKKRGYKANPAGNYTPKNNYFKSSSSELEFINKVNKQIQYNLGLIIRAELYRRGYTYRALWNLCQERGYRYKLGTITAICNGSGHRWNYLVTYKLAYVLGIDLDPLQIPDAINYLRANGRSVKEF